MEKTEYIKKLVRKKIAILGLGKNNFGLLGWLLKNGAQDITIFDQNESIKVAVQKSDFARYGARLKYQTGKAYLKGIEDFEILFRTPGIPFLSSAVQKARYGGVQISSQTKLFLDLCPAKIIGITGTKGKGTTATLLFQMLSQKYASQKANVYLAGNIGVDPFDFISQLKEDDLVIYELSSFMLQDLTKSPPVAVVLDITEDHLDHHKDQCEYLKSKQNIVCFQEQGGTAIINFDSLNSFALAGISPANVHWFSTREETQDGAYFKNGNYYFSFSHQDLIISEHDILLKGDHNRENILAAMLTAKLLGVSKKHICEVLEKFKPLEHRLQPVCEKNGIIAINDSYSTTPLSVKGALSAYPQSILLMGGKSKNTDFIAIAKIIRQKVRHLILFGEASSEIKAILPKTFNKFTKVKNLSDAVREAVKLAQNGDTILLSPGCASFDEFKNATERGKKFVQLINELL
ncbi:UDP-N-acetylmuramoyl-L-alanine--D-glutamate ligase [Candidatus Berkelbacteria bacterium]|nr:UDP-N-acetylmuramoyl-L-alanine--D-glutamate ligase [Candidatus Berkelbacteria bacterium]